MDSNLIVVFACFVINLLILGAGRLSPVYYVECMTRYNANREDASFPFVLSCLMRTAPGPIIGVIGRKYGLKETTIFGCLLTVIGIATSYLAEDILAIKIFWGLIFGLGYGFSSALLPVILTNLYENHQAKANGFALAGSCVGGICLPVILQYLVEYYGTSGSFLLLAGIILHSIPAALLLKNPKCRQNISQVFYEDETNKFSENNSIFAVNCPDASYEETEEKGFESSSKRLNSTSCIMDICDFREIKECHCDQCKITKRNIISQDILCSEKNFNETYLNSISKGTFKKDADCSNDRNKIKTCCDHFMNRTKALLKTFSILANAAFVIITTAQSILVFISFTFLTILIDFVRDKNIPRDKHAYFLICFSIFDFVGNILLGFVTDRRYMTRTNYVSLCFFLIGIFHVVLVLVTSFTLVLLGACFIGLLIGTVQAVFPGIYHEFIKINHRTMAISSGYVLYAPLSFATSPLIGYFRGTLGSYDGIMYISAFASVFCSCLTGLLPCLIKKNEVPESLEEKM